LEPFYYEVFIKPYFSAFREPEFYTGHVSIKFKCFNTTSKLVMHMNENLEIDNDSFELVSLTQANFAPIKRLMWDFDSKRELLIIDLNQETLLENNNYMISVGFKGYLKQDKVGLYKGYYKDVNGNKK